jgi:hypothetical protein
VLLVAAGLIAGLLVFQDFGLSWDEPLFYEYAASIGYAYSPLEWFSGDFNLERAFGPSAADHANRGPGYLLLASLPEDLLEVLGFGRASAWHLTNFVTFQLGVLAFYYLSLRWLRPWAAFGAASLLSLQPLLWGHAFINPKDIPFMAFFTASVWLGMSLVDTLANRAASTSRVQVLVWASGLVLGIATSIRVLAPLAAVLVLIYAASRFPAPGLAHGRATGQGARRPWPALGYCAAIAATTTLITWPYLWPAPVVRFIQAFGFMAENPTQLAVLFQGTIFQADELPRRYLPSLLAMTLTEPVWPLACAGLIAAIWQRASEAMARCKQHDRASRRREAPSGRLGLPMVDLTLLVLWFAIPFAYVVVRRPPMYDGVRHFFFMLPPLFVWSGIAIDTLFRVITRPWFSALILAGLIAPGILSIAKLHPYSYAYYNVLAGGTAGAFRRYETEYWLTCYKEAVERLAANVSSGTRLFVRREPQIAAYYAGSDLAVRDWRLESEDIRTGDYVLASTRSNEDLRIERDAPVALTVGRAGADFCVVKLVTE